MKIKPIDITHKALCVIKSCSSLDHIQMMDDYVDLACRRILRRKTKKNYEYIKKIQSMAHQKTVDIVRFAHFQNKLKWDAIDAKI